LWFQESTIVVPGFNHGGSRIQPWWFQDSTMVVPGFNHSGNSEDCGGPRELMFPHGETEIPANRIRKYRCFSSDSVKNTSQSDQSFKEFAPLPTIIIDEPTKFQPLPRELMLPRGKTGIAANRILEYRCFSFGNLRNTSQSD
jgi:hypothetical protein